MRHNKNNRSIDQRNRRCYLLAVHTATVGAGTMAEPKSPSRTSLQERLERSRRHKKWISETTSGGGGTADSVANAIGPQPDSKPKPVHGSPTWTRETNGSTLKDAEVSAEVMDASSSSRACNEVPAVAVISDSASVHSYSTAASRETLAFRRQRILNSKRGGSGGSSKTAGPTDPLSPKTSTSTSRTSYPVQGEVEKDTCVPNAAEEAPAPMQPSPVALDTETPPMRRWTNNSRNQPKVHPVVVIPSPSQTSNKGSSFSKDELRHQQHMKYPKQATSPCESMMYQASAMEDGIEDAPHSDGDDPPTVAQARAPPQSKPNHQYQQQSMPSVSATFLHWQQREKRELQGRPSSASSQPHHIATTKSNTNSRQQGLRLHLARVPSETPTTADEMQSLSSEKNSPGTLEVQKQPSSPAYGSPHFHPSHPLHQLQQSEKTRPLSGRQLVVVSHQMQSHSYRPQRHSSGGQSHSQPIPAINSDGTTNYKQLLKPVRRDRRSGDGSHQKSAFGAVIETPKKASVSNLRASFDSRGSHQPIMPMNSSDPRIRNSLVVSSQAHSKHQDNNAGAYDPVFASNAALKTSPEACVPNHNVAAPLEFNTSEQSSSQYVMGRPTSSSSVSPVNQNISLAPTFGTPKGHKVVATPLYVARGPKTEEDEKKDCDDEVETVATAPSEKASIAVDVSSAADSPKRATQSVNQYLFWQQKAHPSDAPAPAPAKEAAWSPKSAALQLSPEAERDFCRKSPTARSPHKNKTTVYTLQQRYEEMKHSPTKAVRDGNGNNSIENNTQQRNATWQKLDGVNEQPLLPSLGSEPPENERAEVKQLQHIQGEIPNVDQYYKASWRVDKSETSKGTQKSRVVISPTNKMDEEEQANLQAKNINATDVLNTSVDETVVTSHTQRILVEGISNAGTKKTHVIAGLQESAMSPWQQRIDRQQDAEIIRQKMDETPQSEPHLLQQRSSAVSPAASKPWEMDTKHSVVQSWEARKSKEIVSRSIEEVAGPVVLPSLADRRRNIHPHGAEKPTDVDDPKNCTQEIKSRAAAAKAVMPNTNLVVERHLEQPASKPVEIPCEKHSPPSIELKPDSPIDEEAFIEEKKSGDLSVDEDKIFGDAIDDYLAQAKVDVSNANRVDYDQEANKEASKRLSFDGEADSYFSGENSGLARGNSGSASVTTHSKSLRFRSSEPDLKLMNSEDMSIYTTDERIISGREDNVLKTHMEQLNLDADGGGDKTKESQLEGEATEMTSAHGKNSRFPRLSPSPKDNGKYRSRYFGNESPTAQHLGGRNKQGTMKDHAISRPSTSRLSHKAVDIWAVSSASQEEHQEAISFNETDQWLNRDPDFGAFGDNENASVSSTGAMEIKSKEETPEQSTAPTTPDAKISAVDNQHPAFSSTPAAAETRQDVFDPFWSDDGDEEVNNENSHDLFSPDQDPFSMAAGESFSPVDWSTSVSPKGGELAAPTAASQHIGYYTSPDDARLEI